MSKIFENKTLLIHIAAEIIIVIGISFYFSQKNKKLMGHINDLIQRIEEQEDMIQKHEQLINNLNNAINSKIMNNKNLITQTQLQPQPINKNLKKNDIQELPTIKSKFNKKELPVGKTLPNQEPIGVEFHFLPQPISFKQQSNKNLSFNSKVEEIIEEENEFEENEFGEDENLDENLDDELEEELNDLN